MESFPSVELQLTFDSETSSLPFVMLILSQQNYRKESYRHRHILQGNSVIVHWCSEF